MLLISSLFLKKTNYNGLVSNKKKALLNEGGLNYDVDYWIFVITCYHSCGTNKTLLKLILHNF